MISSVSPTDGRLVAEYEETSADDVLLHIENASRKQEEWATIPIAERAIPLISMAELLGSRRRELAELMADEMGKPLREGLAEIDKCASVCRHYADNAKRILAQEPIPTGR